MGPHVTALVEITAVNANQDIKENIVKMVTTFLNSYQNAMCFKNYIVTKERTQNYIAMPTLQYDDKIESGVNTPFMFLLRSLSLPFMRST